MNKCIQFHASNASSWNTVKMNFPSYGKQNNIPISKNIVTAYSQNQLVPYTLRQVKSQFKLRILIS